jgi:hypothetical protein
LEVSAASHATRRFLAIGFFDTLGRVPGGEQSRAALSDFKAPRAGSVG